MATFLKNSFSHLLVGYILVYVILANTIQTVSGQKEKSCQCMLRSFMSLYDIKVKELENKINVQNKVIAGIKAALKSKYIFFEENKAWDDARKACLDLGADLIAINTMEELNVVTDLINQSGIDVRQQCHGGTGRGSGYSAGFWTSGHQKGGTNHWVWGNSSENIMPNLWNPGEPNNGGGDLDAEDCVQLYFMLKLNDLRCYRKQCYICEL